MNRVAVGPKCPKDGGVKVDMVHLDNLVGASSEKGGGLDWSYVVLAASHHKKQVMD